MRHKSWQTQITHVTYEWVISRWALWDVYIAQRVAVCCGVLLCGAVCWSVLQCAAVCWSALQPCHDRRCETWRLVPCANQVTNEGVPSSHEWMTPPHNSHVINDWVKSSHTRMIPITPLESQMNDTPSQLSRHKWMSRIKSHLNESNHTPNTPRVTNESHPSNTTEWVESHPFPAKPHKEQMRHTSWGTQNMQ